MNNSLTQGISLRHLLCLLVMLVGLSSIGAQAQTAAQTLVGSIESVAQDDGYVRISGRNYSYDSEVVEVYLRGEPIESAALDEGMAVRFSIDANGNLLRIDILGPLSQTRLLEQN